MWVTVEHCGSLRVYHLFAPALVDAANEQRVLLLPREYCNSLAPDLKTKTTGFDFDFDF